MAVLTIHFASFLALVTSITCTRERNIAYKELVHCWSSKIESKQGYDFNQFSDYVLQSDKLNQHRTIAPTERACYLTYIGLFQECKR